MIFSLCHSEVRAVHRGSASRCNFVAAWNANHESCRALTLGNRGALEVFRIGDVCVLWGSLLRTLMDVRDQWSCGRSHLLFIERTLKILAPQAGKLHLNALLAESMNTVNCVIYLFDLNRFSNTQKPNFSFDPPEFSLFTPPCRVRWRKINWKESIIKGTGARANAKNEFDSITARKGKRDLCGWVFIMRQLGLRGLINYSLRRPPMILFALSFYIPKIKTRNLSQLKSQAIKRILECYLIFSISSPTFIRQHRIFRSKRIGEP